VTYRVVAFFFCPSPTLLPGNVILLTADEGVREAAKRHNLPSDMWKNLDKRLFNALKVVPSAAANVGVCPSFNDRRRSRGGVQRDPSAPWTASLLKSCMPGCMVKRDGKTMHLTPSVKPVQSIFQGTRSTAGIGTAQCRLGGASC
jgi:hypothetical protein